MLRGIHINNLSDPAAWQFLRAARPRLCKICNPDAGQLSKLRHEIAPDVVIARYVLDAVDLTPTPEQAGERWFRQTRDRLASVAGLITYAEVPVNEAHNRPPALAEYARATAVYVRLAAEIGVKCLVGNFSVGTPEVQDWPAFFPALEAAKRYGGALSLHEYWIPGRFDAPWWVGRWRLFVDATPKELRRPVYLTEYGVDGGLVGRARKDAGWQAFGQSGAQYAADIARADAIQAGYNQEGLLQGYTLFNCGDYANQAWRSFEVAHAPEVAAYVAAGPRQSAPRPAPAPAPQPPKENTMLVDLLRQEFGNKFEDTRQRLPDGDHGLGVYNRRPLTAIEEVAIHHTATSPQTTVEAIYQAHAITNRWAGIGYTVYIRPDGFVYLTGDPETVRAHVGGTDPRDGKGWNVKTLGVCLAGSFMAYQPTDAQLDAARRVIKRIRQLLGRPVPYRGHKEFPGASPTACPGDTWGQWKARLEPGKTTLRFDKIAWATEEVQRILGGEGYEAEAAYVAEHYTADAISRRDAR